MTRTTNRTGEAERDRMMTVRRVARMVASRESTRSSSPSTLRLSSEKREMVAFRSAGVSPGGGGYDYGQELVPQLRDAGSPKYGDMARTFRRR